MLSIIKWVQNTRYFDDVMDEINLRDTAIMADTASHHIN